MCIPAGKSLMVVAALLFAGAVAAQEEIPANWHQVEVIVFAQSDMHGVEKSPLEPALSYPSRLRTLAAAEQLHPPLAADASENERLAALMVPDRFLSYDKARALAGYVPLPPGMRQLDGEAAALRRNGAYRILFHDAWQQPIDSARQTHWVLIRGGDTHGEHRELEGALRLSHARFYHVDTNLWLSRFEAPRPDHPAESEETQQDAIAKPIIVLPAAPASAKSPQLRQIEAISAQFATGEDGISENAFEPGARVIPSVSQVDVLKTSQQVERKQLHYLDHPRMGVLLLITPLRDESEESEDDTVVD